MGDKIISLTADLSEAEAMLGELKGKVLFNATKRAMNKTLKETQRFAIDAMKDKTNLKLAEMKRLLPARYPKQKSIETLRGTITELGVSIPLIYFVQGTKTAENQKGKKIVKRRTLKVQIVKGASTTRPHFFIQKSKFKHRLGQDNAVFSRLGKGKSKWKHESVPGLRTHFLAMQNQLEQFAANLLQTRFVKEVRRLYLDRLRKTI